MRNVRNKMSKKKHFAADKVDALSEEPKNAIFHPPGNCSHHWLFSISELGLLGHLKHCIPMTNEDHLTINIGYIQKQTSDESDLLKFVQDQIRVKHSTFIIKSRSARMQTDFYKPRS